MKLKFVEQPDGALFRVGENFVTAITILKDGNGPMGQYDMIYLFRDDEKVAFAAMPAHQCMFWEFLKEGDLHRAADADSQRKEIEK